jgi:pimeloyl-ACP methyl ester carboxylesterase
VFSHGWPLNADAWDAQMFFLAERGYRVIAHDRRGHGRSDQTWTGNDMDTYADDLARVLDKLDITNAVLIGHSTGGGEVARYVGRHGTTSYDCIKQFSETDFTEDLKKIDVPTLIAHGDDDQIVPIRAAALLSVKLVKNAVLKVYRGAPHGVAQTRSNEVNADVLSFMQIGSSPLASAVATAARDRTLV